MEYEWYENVRNGFTPLCDRCNENINRDEFFTQRNHRGVYCEGCWNWIHLRKWKCNICQATGSHRSEKLLPKLHCKEEVTWLK